MEILKYSEFRRVYRVDAFDKELKKLFNKSSREYKDYLIYLVERLRFLEDSNCRLTEGSFEKLTVTEYELYRIKQKSKGKNVRVIYFYRENDDIVLLAAFEENNKSDYRNNIDKAISRIKHIEKE